MSKEKWVKLLEGIILLSLGVLFCILPFYWNDIENTISVIIGVSLIIVGVVLLAIPLIKDRALLTTLSIIGAFSLALGIAILCKDDIKYLNELIEGILLIALISVGSLLMIDSAIKLFINRSLFINIVEIVIGAGLVASSITFMVATDVKHWSFFVAGIVIGILGIFIGLSAFINFKKLFRLTKKKKEETEEESPAQEESIEQPVQQIEETKTEDNPQIEKTSNEDNQQENKQEIIKEEEKQ